MVRQRLREGSSRVSLSPSPPPTFTAGDRLAAAVARFQRRPIARIGYFINIAALFVTLAPFRDGKVGFLEAAPIWFVASVRIVLIVWARWRFVKLFTRFRHTTLENVDFHRTFWELLVGKRGPKNEWDWKLFDAQREIFSENWAAARALLEDLHAEGRGSEIQVKNDLAFVMAMTGDGSRAVRFAAQAVALAEKLPLNSQIQIDYRNDLLESTRSTLGECLCSAGQYDEAAAILKPIVAQTKIPLALDARRYFYAQCLVGLDRPEEATEVLRANAKGESSWAAKSREALARLTAQPAQEDPPPAP